MILIGPLNLRFDHSVIIFGFILLMIIDAMSRWCRQFKA
jgi:hypothetical protein